MRDWGKWLIVSIGMIWHVAPTAGWAFEPDADACPPGQVAGVLTSASGQITIDGRQAELGQTVCAGQEVETLAVSRASFRLLGMDAPLRLREQSKLVFPSSLSAEASSLIELITGWIYVLGKPRRDYQVNTPFITAGIEGTEFAIQVTDQGTQIYLFEGQIETSNVAGTVSIAAGTKLTVAADGTISRASLDQSQGIYTPLRLASRDVVAWTLHYPDILGSADALNPDLREVGRLLKAGAIDQAVAKLDTSPPSPATNAVRAIIALAQADLAGARTAVDEALAEGATQALTQLALSYVEQADFNLVAARDAAALATELAPENALSWARLAEVELMLDDRSASRLAAERASAIAVTSRTAIVEGCTALAERRGDSAEQRFADALALDSQDPLAWLGRGLVQILQGDITKGRESLETAMLHDPNNALTRAYLGKAYFEERRTGDAATQYAMAQDLDPADPTAFFYDAILKQLDNRPIEALFALDEAIAKNDNRAVYRSRLLLDEDLAARNASHADIYRQLNFNKSAIDRAAQALADSPGEFAAHRFLSKAYADRDRFEIARSSEELQARLLRPFGHDLVRPSALFTDVNLQGQVGPSSIGAGEFNQLFDRQGVNAVVTVAAGENNTLADEVVVSGLADWLQVSAGQFHFETDGFRPNNAIEHDIKTLYAQAAITPALRLESEIRDRRTVNGDISADFEEPGTFDAGDRSELDETVGRIGGRLELSPASSLIGTVGYSEQDSLEERQVEILNFSSKSDSRTASGELQYLFDSDQFDLVIGGQVANRELDRRQDLVFSIPVLPNSTDITTEDIDQYGAYAYGYLNPIDDLTFILGLGYDSIDRSYQVERVSPKFGVQWNPAKWLSVYAAAARATARTFAFGQTVEPTIIASFNQFFDDPDGSRTDLLAARVELRPSQSTRLGVAAYARKLEKPAITDFGAGNITIDFEDEEELDATVYWYQILSSQMSMSAEYRFRHVDIDPSSALVDTPEEIVTQRVPLSLNYFAENGLFGKVSGVYIHQSVNRQPGITRPEGDDSEVFVNAEIGLRLPNRRGVVSLAFNNILDRAMQFQDENFRTTRQTNEVVALGRSILARATLQF